MYHISTTVYIYILYCINIAVSPAVHTICTLAKRNTNGLPWLLYTPEIFNGLFAAVVGVQADRCSVSNV